jgi:hypothetical protein
MAFESLELPLHHHAARRLFLISLSLILSYPKSQILRSFYQIVKIVCCSTTTGASPRTFCQRVFEEVPPTPPQKLSFHV